MSMNKSIADKSISDSRSILDYFCPGKTIKQIQKLVRIADKTKQIKKNRISGCV